MFSAVFFPSEIRISTPGSRGAQDEAAARPAADLEAITLDAVRQDQIAEAEAAETADGQPQRGEISGRAVPIDRDRNAVREAGPGTGGGGLEFDGEKAE